MNDISSIKSNVPIITYEKKNNTNQDCLPSNFTFNNTKTIYNTNVINDHMIPLNIGSISITDINNNVSNNINNNTEDESKTKLLENDRLNSSIEIKTFPKPIINESCIFEIEMGDIDYYNTFKVGTKEIYTNTSREICFLDFDDTILPTSSLIKKDGSIESFKEQLTVLDFIICEFINCLFDLSIEVCIITMASHEWVTLNLKKYLPKLYNLAEKIKIISVLDRYYKEIYNIILFSPSLACNSEIKDTYLLSSTICKILGMSDYIFNDNIISNLFPHINSDNNSGHIFSELDYYMSSDELKNFIVSLKIINERNKLNNPFNTLGKNKQNSEFTIKNGKNIDQKFGKKWNLISIGDSKVEKLALEEICGNNSSYCKIIRLKERPTIEDIIEQFKFLNGTIKFLIKMNSNIQINFNK